MKRDRAYQIVNDIAEDMNFDTHTKQEYRDVISFLSDELRNEKMRKTSDALNEMLKKLRSPWQQKKELQRLKLESKCLRCW